MHYAGPLDVLPIWGVFLATVAVVLLAVDGGFRLGQYRRRRSEQEDRPPVGEMVAATLALLAFMLAFTFGLAASRFESEGAWSSMRPMRSVRAYLRAGLLPEPHRSDVRSLLREYVDVRLEAVQPGKLSQSIGRSEELHARLWAHAVAVGEKNPGSIVVGLFIASLNEVIDLHAKRLALGVRNRIPGTIWAALYFVAIIGTSVMGYHAGLAGSGRSLASRARPRVLGSRDADRRSRPSPGGASPSESADHDRSSKDAGRAESVRVPKASRRCSLMRTCRYQNTGNATPRSVPPRVGPATGRRRGGCRSVTCGVFSSP